MAVGQNKLAPFGTSVSNIDYLVCLCPFSVYRDGKQAQSFGFLPYVFLRIMK
jgi:hypothetical protein